MWWLVWKTLLICVALFGVDGSQPTFAPSQSRSTNNLITTIAGTGGTGSTGVGGLATAALMNNPRAVFKDNFGFVYFSESQNTCMRKFSTSNNIILPAAGICGSGGFSGDGGPSTSALTGSVIDINVDTLGSLYFCDYGNSRIRTAQNSGIIKTYALNGNGGVSGDGGQATSASFGGPQGHWFSSAGVLYITSDGNAYVRMVSAAGIITTFAGTGYFSSDGDGLTATSASFAGLEHVFQDTATVVYISDANANKLRSVSVAGIMSTVFGSGGVTWTEGVANTAQGLNYNVGIGVDTNNGDIYVSCRSSNRVAVASRITGLSNTVAGNGLTTSTGDEGQATAAAIYGPDGICLESWNRLYVMERYGRRVRLVYSINPTVVPTAAPTTPTVTPSIAPSLGPSVLPTLNPTLGPTVLPSVTPTTIAPTRLPSVTPTITPTLIPTVLPTLGPTVIPTVNPTQLPSILPTLTPTVGPSVAPSLGPTVLPTVVPTFLPSVVPTVTPTVKPTAMPTVNPTVGPTFGPTLPPTVTPTLVPTVSPTVAPSMKPSVVPSLCPTVTPSMPPSIAPSLAPTITPTVAPSCSPSIPPTLGPTLAPSLMPTVVPTIAPSLDPTSAPTVVPSIGPTARPSMVPSISPTVQPTVAPSMAPTLTPSRLPSICPSTCPTTVPSLEPTVVPSDSPTVSPSLIPTLEPSLKPTVTPTMMPTDLPSESPSILPSEIPSVLPSEGPTLTPSIAPSVAPSILPTEVPSLVPSAAPTLNPSQCFSVVPTLTPSVIPTQSPTLLPSLIPTVSPSVAPSLHPSSQPSLSPSVEPTVAPTLGPSLLPSLTPTLLPSLTPSTPPTLLPSVVPTLRPSSNPTVLPSVIPSPAPTQSPSVAPSVSPTTPPSILPTVEPSLTPSMTPTRGPSCVPTLSPSQSPSVKPTWQSSSRKASLPGNHSISVVGRQRAFRIVLPLGVTVGPAGSGRASYSDIVLVQGTAGSAFLVWGNKTQVAEVTLKEGQIGSFVGSCAADVAKRSASVLQDVNGDGFDDLIIGDPFFSRCYVLLGNEDGLTNMTSGFTIFGEQQSDLTGWSVSGAGDVNNDTLPDIIVGAPNARGIGAFYVIYGKGTGQWYDLHLSNLTSTEGFAVYGSQKSDFLGVSVSAAGDVNRDGCSDIIVGALMTSNLISGAAFVLYGCRPNPVNTGGLTQDQGFKLSGDAFRYTGSFVSGAGDVNGDGYDDVLVSSSLLKSSDSIPYCYLIFGGESSELSTLLLSSLAVNAGYRITGGGSIPSYAGDVNHDGVSDILVTNADDLEGGGGGVIVYTSIAALTLITAAPSVRPTASPSTLRPTFSVTRVPTVSRLPTAPSAMPTEGVTVPTVAPSSGPTQPSVCPSATPSEAPSLRPTFVVTLQPTAEPSVISTRSPSTLVPSKKTMTREPVSSPTLRPTVTQTNDPTAAPVSVRYINEPNAVYNLSNVDMQYLVNTSGSVTILGSGGVHVYVLYPTDNSTLTIAHFNKSCDVIDLTAFHHIVEFKQLQLSEGSVIVTLSTTQTVHILNLHVVDMGDHNFRFYSGKGKPTLTAAQLLAIKAVSGLAVAVFSLIVLFMLRRGVLKVKKMYEVTPENKLCIVIRTTLDGRQIVNSEDGELQELEPLQLGNEMVSELESSTNLNEPLESGRGSSEVLNESALNSSGVLVIAATDKLLEVDNEIVEDWRPPSQIQSDENRRMTSLHRVKEEGDSDTESWNNSPEYSSVSEEGREQIPTDTNIRITVVESVREVSEAMEERVKRDRSMSGLLSSLDSSEFNSPVGSLAEEASDVSDNDVSSDGDKPGEDAVEDATLQRSERDYNGAIEEDEGEGEEGDLNSIEGSLVDD